MQLFTIDETTNHILDMCVSESLSSSRLILILTVDFHFSLSLFYSTLYSVFESLMETALEENRRMNSDRAEAMLVRAYNMYRHPLLISLQTEAAAAALADPSSVSSTMFKGVPYPCSTMLYCDRRMVFTS